MIRRIAIKSAWSAAWSAAMICIFSSIRIVSLAGCSFLFGSVFLTIGFKLGVHSKEMECRSCIGKK